MSTEERIAVIETEIKYIKADASEIKEKLIEVTNNHLAHINQSLNEIKQNCIIHKERAKKGLSGKDKAVIVASIITAISAVIVTFIQYYL